MEPSGPVYRYIEFCRDPEALWGKLRSGKWDWLGVHPDGKFVVGRPRLKRSSLRAALTVSASEALEGEHGVRTYTPDGFAGERWCNTEEDAKVEFREEVEKQGDENRGPLLLKIHRIEKGKVVDKEFVVRRPTTYL
jgi:hypothetical protein